MAECFKDGKSENECERWISTIAAAERRHRGEGRTPLDLDARDEGWRPLDPARDNIEEPQRGTDYADSYPLADTTVLYYWRETYWRRFVS